MRNYFCSKFKLPVKLRIKIFCSFKKVSEAFYNYRKKTIVLDATAQGVMLTAPLLGFDGMN